jgi:hypothetical protein
MGRPNLDLFRFLALTFNINTFIETGTGHGETIEEIKGMFLEIYTVELSRELYDEVEEKYGHFVHCYYGKSIGMLEEILPLMNGESTLYWLDAHWSGGPTAGEEEQTPLMRELELINKNLLNNDFIIIDDAHTFFSPAALKPPYDSSKYPSIVEIFNELHQKARYTVILHSMRYNDGPNPGIVLPNDFIVSVPLWASPEVRSWLQQLTLEGPA